MIKHIIENKMFKANDIVCVDYSTSTIQPIDGLITFSKDEIKHKNLDKLKYIETVDEITIFSIPPNWLQEYIYNLTAIVKDKTLLPIINYTIMYALNNTSLNAWWKQINIKFYTTDNVLVELSFPWNNHLPSLFYRHYKNQNKEDISDKTEDLAKKEICSKTISAFDVYPFLFPTLDFPIPDINYWTPGTKSCLLLTGTACVGKTTIINKKMQEHNLINLKSVRRGNYKPKDHTIELASLWQLGAIMDAATNIRAIYDRSFIDNLLWRIIMGAMAIYDDCEQAAFIADAMNVFPPESIGIPFFKQFPILVFLSSDVAQTRQKMILRNEGGDLQRARVIKYVELQNAVYGVFAKKYEIPIFLNTQEHLNAAAKFIDKFNKTTINETNNCVKEFEIDPQLQSILVNNNLDVADSIKILK